MGEKYDSSKIPNIVRFCGSLLILAAGVVGCFHCKKIVLNNNDTQEDVVLYNAKNEVNTIKDMNISKKDAAYILADLYLYKSKDIRVTTLFESFDNETSDKIYSSFNNSLIKEISKHEGENFVPMNPTSKEYSQILGLREYLSKNLMNRNIFNEKDNEELVKFADFLKTNAKTEEIKVSKEDELNMYMLTIISTSVLLGLFMYGVEYYREKELD